MTVQTLAFAPEKSPAVNSWFDRCFPIQEYQPKRERLEANIDSTPAFGFPWHALAESLPGGVMVISRNVKLVYLNQQAKELCRILSQCDRHWAILPEVVSEICHKLIRNGNFTVQPIIGECQTAERQTIRVRASWLNLGAGEGCDREYILVFLENRDEILQAELQFEQQKYQLTDREMEIWKLLRQESSYQEIAATLHISLNTVKTHVKNIYAKKRWNEVQDKVLVG